MTTKTLAESGVTRIVMLPTAEPQCIGVPAAPKGYHWSPVLVPSSSHGPAFIDGRGLAVVNTAKALALRVRAAELTRKFKIERAVVREIVNRATVEATMAYGGDGPEKVKRMMAHIRRKARRATK
jgi:uncharacterized protein (DUF433 family)